MKVIIKCITLAALASFATALDCTADVVVKSQADIKALGTCQVFAGKITVSQVPIEELDFTGLQEVRGELRFTDINSVTKISLPDLKVVSGALKFESVRDLHVISMPKLIAVGNFVLSTAPALTTLEFSAGLSQANAITVSDTTATEVRGINVAKVQSLVVDNNHYLKNVNLSSVTDISESIRIAANAPGFNVDLSKLQTLKSADFRNIEGILLPELNKVDGDLTLISNTFNSLDIPKLKTVAKTITIGSSNNLSKLGMQELTFVGGALSVGDNPHLTIIDSFPKLNEVDGTVDITGGYDDLQLPSLTDVRGGMNLQTSSKQFSCDAVNKVRTTVVKGNSYLCKSAVANPTSTIQGVGKLGKGDSIGAASSGSQTVLINTVQLGVASMFVAMMLA